MAIWGCVNDTNDLARLLEMAMPQVDTDAEMLKLEPDTLKAVERMADSFTDCLLSQQDALADLMANADTLAIEKDTLQQAGWLLRQLTQVHELTRRIASIAGAYSDPETRALYLAMGRGDIAQVARLTQ